ncbi:MAG: preprotein translocase subunit SecG [Alphaproteobacteria bacterium]
MIQIVLTIHILIAAALVVMVLMQKSEGGGLGIGGGGGGGGGLMTGRSAANFLSKTTGMLAAGFFATSLGLAILASGSNAPTSIIEQTAPSAEPKEPAAPLAQ